MADPDDKPDERGEPHERGTYDEHGEPDEPTARTIVLALRGPITPAHVPWLCERLRVLLQSSDAELVTLDVGALAEPDVVTLEALARLQLTARRLGRRLRLRHAGDGLRVLLASAGLDEALPLCPGSPASRPALRRPGLRLEPGGQAEQREQPGGVQE
ncbi:STAS domain-containing protein [Streptomyces sp. 8N616]|uniref:STAS domain-containing protein n=1 Tax=Streptomyces sp. 8N616 TaxID=3457414 RepID=UPI003FD3DCED